MKRPKQPEIERALDAAHGLLGHAGLADIMARYLLYLDNRNQRLESIATVLEHYLNFGQPEVEHGKLIKLVQQLREENREEEDIERGEFGLE